MKRKFKTPEYENGPETHSFYDEKKELTCTGNHLMVDIPIQQ